MKEGLEYALEGPDEDFLQVGVVEEGRGVGEVEVEGAGHGVVLSFECGKLQGPEAVVDAGTIEVVTEGGVEAVALGEPVFEGAGLSGEDGGDGVVGD